MEIEVYADLYFLVNASMDLLCLMITAALLHRGLQRWRALLASAIGGGYALAALLLGLGGVLGLACDLLAVTGICTVALYERGMRPWRLLQCAAADALVSMLLGGIMTVLFTWLNRLNLPLEALRGDGLSAWIFALFAAVSGILTLKGGRFFGRANRTESATLEVTLLGKRLLLRAMVDSGNLLRDPVSGRGVIVVERTRLEGLLPRELLEGNEWMKHPDLASRVRLIPTQTATGEGMLLGIRPDRLRITDRDGTETVEYIIAAADLGDRAQGFDALIGKD